MASVVRGQGAQVPVVSLDDEDDEGAVRRAVCHGSEAKRGAAFEGVDTAAPSNVESDGGAELAFASDGPVRLGFGELHRQHATDDGVGISGA